MQKKQGNISILVLFVLVACSLIGVLTMNFVNQMLYASDNFLSYYKSYYLANAGLELSLAAASHHGVGWEMAMGTGSSIVSQNFGCSECDITASISGTSAQLCKTLDAGESMMIPLFKDIGTGIFADIDYQNLSSSLSTWAVTSQDELDMPAEINIGLVILSGDELLSDGIFVRTGILDDSLISNFLSEFALTMSAQSNYFLQQNLVASDYPFKNYLILANTTSGQVVSFCIDSPELALPMDNFYARSNGRYHAHTLGLEALSKQPIPDFLLNTSWSN